MIDYAMGQDIDGREEELGFCIEKKKRRIHPPVITIDTDFAEDIALTSENI